MKLKSGNRFSMKAQGDSAEILIYEEIGASFWGGGISPKQFADDLTALGDIQTLNVHINSPGGDVFDGVTIYNLLAQHNASVNVYVDGIAASVASVIAMAGEKIYIAENAMMMIHNPWGGAMGEAADMRKMADILDKVKESMIPTYAKRSGLKASEISSMMDAETWLTGQEAVDKGLADELQNARASAKARGFAKADARFNLSHFKNAPKTLRNAACECGCPECLAGDCAQCTNPNCKDPNCDCTDSAEAKAGMAWAAPPEYYHQRLALYQRTLK